MMRTETQTMNLTAILLVLFLIMTGVLFSTAFLNVDSAALAFSPPALTAHECTPRTEWARYALRDGESLEMLAHQLAISLEMLLDANCADSNTISSGAVVYVPALPAS